MRETLRNPLQSLKALLLKATLPPGAGASLKATRNHGLVRGGDHRTRLHLRAQRTTELMPMGSTHDEIGLLEGHHGLALERQEGGTWRLDASRRARKPLGRRVRLTNRREKLDLLLVTSIEAA